MRIFVRWFLRIILVVLSVDSFIALVDYGGRWDWLETAMVAHPAIASLVRGPTFPLFC